MSGLIDQVFNTHKSPYVDVENKVKDVKGDVKKGRRNISNALLTVYGLRERARLDNASKIGSNEKIGG